MRTKNVKIILMLALILALSGSASATTYEELILADDPIAYYRLNDRPLGDVLEPNDFTFDANDPGTRLTPANELTEAINLGSTGTTGRYSFALFNSGPDSKPGRFTSVPSLLPHDFGDGDTAMEFFNSRVDTNMSSELSAMGQTGTWEAWVRLSDPVSTSHAQDIFARDGSENPGGEGSNPDLYFNDMGRQFNMTIRQGAVCFNNGVGLPPPVNCYESELYPAGDLPDDPGTPDVDESRPGFTPKQGSGGNVPNGSNEAYNVKPTNDPNDVDHVVFVYDSLDTHERSLDSNNPVGFRRFYLDGQLISETTTPFELSTNTPIMGVNTGQESPFIVGSRFDDTRHAFAGVLDETAVYGYALSDEQVLAHFNCGSTGDCDVVPALACDFNGDTVCDVADVDLMTEQGDLVAGIPVGEGNPFDLNDDETVDNTDIDQWLSEAATENGYASPYLRGDTDDVGAGTVRDVDITDFNTLVVSFDPTGAITGNNWSSADFDGDGDVDITDFNVQVVNFTPTGYAPQSSVPEPTAVAMFVFGLIAIARLVVSRNGYRSSSSTV